MARRVFDADVTLRIKPIHPSARDPLSGETSEDEFIEELSENDKNRISTFLRGFAMHKFKCNAPDITYEYDCVTIKLSTNKTGDEIASDCTYIKILPASDPQYALPQYVLQQYALHLVCMTYIRGGVE